MNKQEIKQLKDFLVARKVFKSFCRNVKAMTKLSFVKNGEATIVKSGAISESFYWDRTPEGVTFWGKVNDEWEAIVRAEEEKEEVNRILTLSKN